MSKVTLKQVRKSYGAVNVVNDVSLDIAHGEFVTILGASGSGKTTCLRMVAGFVTPDSGHILLGEENVTHVPAHKRNTAMVFQQYALFPHLSVAENVQFGLKVRGIERREAERRTQEALKLVHLDELGHRYPRQLSGGQRQRVALARAVVIKPKVLLLDEPLGALDLKLREELQGEIKRVQQSLGITTLFVTHDQGEALGMSDRVVVMRNGQIDQVAAPEALYNRPTSVYVANFVGRTNTISAQVVEGPDVGGVYTLASDVSPQKTLRAFNTGGGRFSVGDTCLVCFRPENVHLGNVHPNRIVVTSEKATYHGDNWSLSCISSEGSQMTLRLPKGSDIPSSQAAVSISWPVENSFILKPDA
ncbi:MAG: ABC transporter ATP-binding protein [Mesorhizobium sp.]